MGTRFRHAVHDLPSKCAVHCARLPVLAAACVCLRRPLSARFDGDTPSLRCLQFAEQMRCVLRVSARIGCGLHLSAACERLHGSMGARRRCAVRNLPGKDAALRTPAATAACAARWGHAIAALSVIWRGACRIDCGLRMPVPTAACAARWGHALVTLSAIWRGACHIDCGLRMSASTAACAVRWGHAIAALVAICRANALCIANVCRADCGLRMSASTAACAARWGHALVTLSVIWRGALPHWLRLVNACGDRCLRGSMGARHRCAVCNLPSKCAVYCACLPCWVRFASACGDRCLCGSARVMRPPASRLILLHHFEHLPDALQVVARLVVYDQPALV